MTYIVIAYKPTSDDICMGQHMATYDSDFVIRRIN